MDEKKKKRFLSSKAGRRGYKNVSGPSPTAAGNKLECLYPKLFVGTLICVGLGPTTEQITY